MLNDLIEQDHTLVLHYMGSMTYKEEWVHIPANGPLVRETGIIIFTAGLKKSGAKIAIRSYYLN